MYPCMNVEDLAKGKVMLLLINSRGRYQPRIFTDTDLGATSLGQLIDAIGPSFLEDHVLLLEGETVEEYGQLIPMVDDDENLQRKIKAGLAYMPSQGLLALEIQEKILQFLVQFCEELLHDFHLGP